MQDEQSYQRIKVQQTDGIGHITLNCPDEYNRMPPAFWSELPRSITELDSTGTARAAIISSTGKHFTAGLDTSSFGGGSGSRACRLGRRVWGLAVLSAQAG